ncbi:AraC family transcriptional regulator [Actinomadura spongiicola]|uniref:AraC family transcriptional regulator n=1 Tax=Actinomadura spongiicola TaxID=2303421 RepID=A0A372GQF8_9ACTN|nr:AraC family transcriptional regulator [Actinomadura spongiicola]RFS87575.1 AraC family transcriptional regulator [Actinomadura spongiicola]
MDVLADILTAMRVGTPVAAHTEAHAPWGLRFDHTTGAGFHVVLQGSCWLTPLPGDTAQFAPLELGPGDVVLLGSGAKHAITSTPGTPLTDFSPVRNPTASPLGRMVLPGPGARSTIVCGAYRLRRHRPHPLLRDLPDVVHLSALPGRHHGLRAMVELLGDELESPSPGAAAVTPSLVDALLVYMLRAWLRDTPDGWSAAFADPATARALAAMHAEPARPWTVEQLGFIAGLSRAAFARRFTTFVGEPPLTYLTRWRMTIAARLLRDTDKSLEQIAGAIGYGSAFAFAKAFRREYATTPGEYRIATRTGITQPASL